MKGGILMKRLVSILAVAILFLTVGSTVFGYDTTLGGFTCFMYSYGYSYNAPLKVLNVYTSGTPVSGDLVTLYSWSESDTQRWKILANDDIDGVANDTYRVLSVAANTLALNYNQATTKCTVYPFDGNVNDYHDYPVDFEEVTNGHVIWLHYRSGRYLGNSANVVGAQCYWYLISNTGIHQEDIWCLFA